MLEDLNKQRKSLMKLVFKIIQPKDSAQDIFELNKDIVNINETPSFTRVNLAGDSIMNSSQNLIQCFGILPNINQENSSKLLKTIADKLSPSGILFSDFPLVNDLDQYNYENVLNSGLRVKNTLVNGINYQVLEKPLSIINASSM